MFYGQHTSVFRVLFCVVLFVATERILAADSPSVTGLWKNEDASFEVYEENGKLNAKIVSLREPLAPDGRPVISAIADLDPAAQILTLFPKYRDTAGMLPYVGNALGKPFTESELLTKVRRALVGPTPPPSP